jgi:hypothetical protein
LLLLAGFFLLHGIFMPPSYLRLFGLFILTGYFRLARSSNCGSSEAI